MLVKYHPLALKYVLFLTPKRTHPWSSWSFPHRLGNVVRYERKNCGKSESTVIKEFEVISKLRGATGVVQCVGDSVHEREFFHYKVYGFFMEYAACGTLDAKIKTHPKGLSIAIVSSFTRMILVGLRSIHGVGFVHGYLHSEILEEPKVCDFGFAKRVGEDDGLWSRENKFLGCPDYMSPESMCKGTLVEAHNIWAVGCLVSELCTNKPSWSKNYETWRINNFLAQDLHFSINIAPKIPLTLPDAAREFLKVCLAIDPEERKTVEHSFVVTQEV